MVVQALRHQVLGQRVRLPGGLLDLGPFVLEPDLDLGLVQTQILGQVLPPLLRQVPVVLELGLQPLQLLRAEGGSGPLVVPAGARGPAGSAGPGPCGAKQETVTPCSEPPKGSGIGSVSLGPKSKPIRLPEANRNRALWIGGPGLKFLLRLFGFIFITIIIISKDLIQLFHLLWIFFILF